MQNHIACPLFAALLTCTAVTAQDPPIAHDPDRNLHIPAQADLVKTLRVAALYDGEHFQIRYEFPTETPGWYHTYRVYEQGRWHNLHESTIGPEPHGLFEDRISIAIDRGLVQGFDRYGGFILARPGVHSRTDEIQASEVVQHPHFRDRLDTDEVLKFIPESRTQADLHDVAPDLWSRVRSPDELEGMRREGRFIDTWQWRAHRSNPIGYGDNGYVLDYRHASAGRGMYTSNWDADNNRPRWMYDVEKTGIHALDRDRLLARGYTQDDPYYLSEETAVPFDPERHWQDGDVLPGNILREPEGSRGALRAEGRFMEGAWRVRITRTLEAPNPLDSHDLRPGSTYNVQFAVHTNAQGARWHYVSMPLTLGLAANANIRARSLDDDQTLDEGEAAWVEIPIIYPGQATLADLLNGPEPLIAAFNAALADPMDPQAARHLAVSLVRHELATFADPAGDPSPQEP